MAIDKVPPAFFCDDMEWCRKGGIIPESECLKCSKFNDFMICRLSDISARMYHAITELEPNNAFGEQLVGLGIDVW